jgi:hypothetical protein
MSYPDLIKFPYFVDLTQRGNKGGGWKEAQREGNFKENSNVSRLWKPQIEYFKKFLTIKYITKMQRSPFIFWIYFGKTQWSELHIFQL